MTTLTRVSNEAISFPLSATNPDGSPATITGAKVAILPKRRGPNAATVWTTATFAAGTVTVRLAGPDADPTGATLIVPEAGGDLWALPLGITDYNPVKITRIYLLGGTGTPAAGAAPFVTSVGGLTGTITTEALLTALGLDYVGLDSDLVPYYDPTGVTAPFAPLRVDTDGVLYYVA